MLKIKKNKWRKKAKKVGKKTKKGRWRRRAPALGLVRPKFAPALFSSLLLFFSRQKVFLPLSQGARPFLEFFYFLRFFLFPFYRNRIFFLVFPILGENHIYIFFSFRHFFFPFIFFVFCRFWRNRIYSVSFFFFSPLWESDFFSWFFILTDDGNAFYFIFYKQQQKKRDTLFHICWWHRFTAPWVYQAVSPLALQRSCANQLFRHAVSVLLQQRGEAHLGVGTCFWPRKYAHNQKVSVLASG